MLPILYRTIRPSIPMERGTFARGSACHTTVPIPGTGDYRIYEELMHWGGKPPTCYGHYIPNRDILSTAFFVFFYLSYLLFTGLAGGMPAVSRGPVPLDSYRVSHITDFVKYFFYFFLLFLSRC